MNLNLFPSHIKNKILKGKSLSHTKLKTIECPQLFKFQYEDKLEQPFVEIMAAGNYYDSLCNGEHLQPDGRIPDERVVSILRRYELYKDHILPEDRLQVPLWREIPDTEYVLIGWADRVRDSITGLFDHKLAEVPWTDSKYKAAQMQLRLYFWMAEGMSLHLDKGFFHVVNMENEDIQEFGPYKPTAKGLLAIPAILQEAIKKIQSPDREPVLSFRCEWETKDGRKGQCGYHDICPLMKQLAVPNDEGGQLESAEGFNLVKLEDI